MGETIGDVFFYLHDYISVVIIGLVTVVLIVVIGQIIKARVSAISERSFEKLTTELKEENVKILTELADMKENLSSINKMMKEIE